MTRVSRTTHPASSDNPQAALDDGEATGPLLGSVSDFVSRPRLRISEAVHRVPFPVLDRRLH